jgi:tetratricopeptide (TPR) repeat protein
MTEFEAFASEVARLISERRVAVFCGAGVSRPSGLPVVSEVLADLFAWLELGPVEVAQVTAAAIPFERVMELILAELPSRKPFLDLFNVGTPSLFHHFISALHERQLIRLVATTNFDRLLEHALESSPSRGPFEVAIEPAQLCSLIEPSTENLRIAKLHGCVSRPQTIATELYMVGSALLTPARRSAIESVFASGLHSHVLVLGYSCSDVFDIGPILTSLGGGSKAVLFVSHRPIQVGADPVLELCDCPPSTSTFPNWTAVATDTGQLIATLCDLLDLEPHGVPEQPPIWRSALQVWLADCAVSKPASRKLAASAILAAAGMVEAAIGRITMAMTLAERVGDRDALTYCHLDLAHRKIRHTGALGAAAEHIEVARRLLGQMPARGRELRLVHLEADLAKLTGDFAKSVACLEKAIDLCENHLERADSEYLLALLYRKTGEYQKSERHFHQALTAFDAAGNLVDKARAVGDLGNLYAEIGDLEAAVEQYQQGLELSRLAGDKHGEGVRHANLGMVAIRQGDVDRGIAELTWSIDAARVAGDVAALGSRIGNLGMIFYRERQLDAALSRFEEARELASRAGNRDLELRWISNIGVTLGRLGRTGEAIDRFEEAQTGLSEILGDEHPRVRWVRDCLIFARSQAIQQIAGDPESGLMMLGPGGMSPVSWDALAP